MTHETSWKQAFHSLSQQMHYWARRARHAGVGAILSLPLTVVWADTAAPHWINYAQQFSEQLQAHVHNQDSVASHSLADWAHQENHSRLGPVQARFWLNHDGSVRDLQIDSLDNAQADENLREVVRGVQLRFGPPADMPQPLRVSLQWLYPQQEEQNQDS